MKPDFEFWVNDEFEVLKNILLKKTEVSENELEIEIGGSIRQIKAYLTHFKFAARKQIINFKQKLHNTNKKVQNLETITATQSIPVQITDDMLEKVRELLPEQPWEKGINIEVAAKLGYTKSCVKKCITILIKKGFFKHQINGILVDSYKNPFGKD